MKKLFLIVLIITIILFIDKNKEKEETQVISYEEEKINEKNGI